MKDNDNQPSSFSPNETQQPPVSQGEESDRSVYRTEEVDNNYSQGINQQQVSPDSVPQRTQTSPESVLANQTAVQSAGGSEQVGVLVDEMGLPRKKRRSPIKIVLSTITFILILGVLVAVVYKLQLGQIGDLFGNKGELVWWGIMEDEAVARSLIEEYIEDNPEVKIVYKRQSSQDYRVRLTNSLAGGNGPDLFEFHNSWVPMFSNELSALPEDIMSQTEYSQTFYPIIVSDLLTGKGIVGIPLFYDAITLYINEDIFASVAQKAPQTWNELVDLVNPETGDLTLTDGKGTIIQSGIALGTTSNIDFWQDILALMMVQNGADLKNPTGERASDALSFYRLFSKKGAAVWNESLPDSTVAFGQGKVAMYLGPTRKAVEIAQINSDFRFKTVPLPQLPKNKPTDPDITYATYWIQGVWEKSASKEEAWKFLRFLSERASFEKLNNERKKVKNFELAPPRMDMARIYIQDPILSSVVILAPNARSWYLADETYDGDTGINTRVASLYEKAANAKGKPEDELSKIAPELARTLSQYGVVKVTPIPTKPR